VRKTKIYLFNDTSRARHAGCRAVMRSLRAELSEFSEIIATHSVGSTKIDSEAMAHCDAVVVNGEGTIHHDSPRANFLLMALAMAQAAGKRSALINAVYQQEQLPMPMVLQQLDLFSVREVRSAAWARGHGGRPWVYVDSAADRLQLQDVPAMRAVEGVVKGGVHPKAPSATWLDTVEAPQLDLSTGTLDQIVSTLRQAEIYVTGQHHGVYAAALAGIPFVAMTSNSHKVEGLIEWSGLPIPVVTQLSELPAALEFARSERGVFKAFAEFIANQDVIRAPLLRQSLAH
jgi:hypothetical protein